jgi:hypothetical protein
MNHVRLFSPRAAYMDRLQCREVGNPVPGFPVESCLIDQLRTALFAESRIRGRRSVS